MRVVADISMPATASPDCMAICVPAEQNETFVDSVDLLNEDDDGLPEAESLSLLSQQHRKDVVLATIHEGPFHHEPDILTPVSHLLPPIPEADGWSDNEVEYHEKSLDDYEEDDFLEDG